MNFKVGVIDHGVGNSIAILNLLRKIGVQAARITSPSQFLELSTSTSKLILPGVGSFDAGVKSLKSSGLDESIRSFASADGHILGICLGMELLFDESEEGVLKGLSLITGSLVRMQGDSEFRVPHVGWEKILPVGLDPIFAGITRMSFYHNHSFALPSPNPYEIAKIDYDSQYTVAVRCKNILGVQFHPEKSHSSGEKLIKNFIEAKIC